MAEPVTTAVLAAIAAGATAGVTDTVKQEIGKGYTAPRRCWCAPSVTTARSSRRSTSWRKTPAPPAASRPPARMLTKRKAGTNPELIAAAEQVLARLQELPQGERQHIMQAIGSYIAMADRGATAKVTVLDWQAVAVVWWWRAVVRWWRPGSTTPDQTGSVHQAVGSYIVQADHSATAKLTVYQTVYQAAAPATVDEATLAQAEALLAEVTAGRGAATG